MTRIRPAAVIVAVLLSAAADAADPCDPQGDLEGALDAARSAVQEARDSLAAAEDLAAPLASARAAVDAAGVVLEGISAPGELVATRTRVRSKLARASSSVERAERVHGRSRLRGLLRRAARSVDRARSIVGAVTAPSPCAAIALNGSLGDVQVFPADNWWNEDVSARPVAANSDAVIDFIGRAKPLHADFGTTFGIPYVVLDGPHDLVPVTFGYADESDAGAPGRPAGYPIPVAARTVAGYVEGGVAGGGTSGDRHLLIVDRGSNLLYELFAARWTGSAWTAGSGAVFDLSSNARRPEGWTSADAAGLAILPGLVRADEVFEEGKIRHALRFTVRATQGYVFPASHDATHGAGGDLRPPLGLRVRLKADVDLTPFSPPARVVLAAMKRYGMILADNGSDWFVTGAPDPRWDDERMHDDFARVTGDDFEVVE